MSYEVVIHAAHLGKCFKLYANPWRRAVEWASLGKRSYHQPFWALRDVSFEVRRGECFGVIGPNGAGKTTLLKLLTGKLTPTTGTIAVNGTTFSLFNLSAGFHPDLTGRENLARVTALLHLPRKYVREQLVRIEEFAELGEFLDRPVGIYSSGMRTRLAFSLFAFLACDVLILDEVLATGDIFFKQKCYARLEQLMAQQTTILLVTHATNVIRQYCQRVLLLDHGRAVYQGDPAQAIQAYLTLQRAPHQPLKWMDLQEDLTPVTAPTGMTFDWPPDEAFTPFASAEGRGARLVRFAICNKQGVSCTTFAQGEDAYFYCEWQMKQTIGVPITRVMLTNLFNTLVHAKSSLPTPGAIPRQVREGAYLRLYQRITLGLQAGQYVFGLSLSTLHPEDYDRIEDPAAEDLSEHIMHLFRREQVGSFTIMPYKGQKLTMPYWGVCDLPGEVYIQQLSSGKE